MDESTIVGILLIVAVTAALGFGMYLRYKVKMHLQDTVRLAIEKCNELNPELIDRIMDPGPRRSRGPTDLRRGVIALALAIPIVGVAFAMPEPDVTRGFLAAAGVPASIGLAYLALWLIGERGRGEHGRDSAKLIT